MTTKRGGRPYKDAKITENFNQTKEGITQSLMAKVKRATKGQSKLAPKRSHHKKVMKVTGYDDEGWPIFGEQATPAKTQPAAAQNDLCEEDDDGLASAQKMLEDMRWVYKQSKGKAKLLALVENDKEFLSLVKELMKAEVSILTNRLKAGGGGKRQGFFVVLKGLESEKPVLNVVDKMSKKLPIDYKQIEEALNPESNRTPEDWEEGAREAPAEIIQQAKPIEKEEE